VVRRSRGRRCGLDRQARGHGTGLLAESLWHTGRRGSGSRRSAGRVPGQPDTGSSGGHLDAIPDGLWRAGADRRIKAGDFISIPAASSSVGLAQFRSRATMALTAIAVTRSAAKARELLALGAHHVIVSDKEGLPGADERDHGRQGRAHHLRSGSWAGHRTSGRGRGQ